MLQPRIWERVMLGMLLVALISSCSGPTSFSNGEYGDPLGVWHWVSITDTIVEANVEVVRGLEGGNTEFSLHGIELSWEAAPSARGARIDLVEGASARDHVQGRSTDWVDGGRYVLFLIDTSDSEDQDWIIRFALDTETYMPVVPMDEKEQTIYEAIVAPGNRGKASSVQDLAAYIQEWHLILIAGSGTEAPTGVDRAEDVFAMRVAQKAKSPRVLRVEAAAGIQTPVATTPEEASAAWAQRWQDTPPANRSLPIDEAEARLIGRQLSETLEFAEVAVISESDGLGIDAVALEFRNIGLMGKLILNAPEDGPAIFSAHVPHSIGFRLVGFESGSSETRRQLVLRAGDEVASRARTGSGPSELFRFDLARSLIGGESVAVITLHEDGSASLRFLGRVEFDRYITSLARSAASDG